MGATTFGFVLTVGQQWILGLSASLVATGVIVSYIRKATRWVRALVTEWREDRQKTKDAILDVRVQLGDNGGGTIQQSIQKVLDQITIQRATSDAMSRPCVVFAANGEVASIFLGFSEATGWHRADLEDGLWRAKLSEPDRLNWDRLLQYQQAYDGVMTIECRNAPARSMRTHIRPIWSAGDRRLLGWCGVFDRRTLPREPGDADGESQP